MTGIRTTRGTGSFSLHEAVRLQTDLSDAATVSTLKFLHLIDGIDFSLFRPQGEKGGIAQLQNMSDLKASPVKITGIQPFPVTPEYLPRAEKNGFRIGSDIQPHSAASSLKKTSAGGAEKLVFLLYSLL